MKKGVRRMVVASMAALCALGASFSTSAYELNPEVKDVTPALREASTVGVWTSENPFRKPILGYLYMKLIPPISSSIESRQRKEFRS